MSTKEPRTNTEPQQLQVKDNAEVFVRGEWSGAVDLAASSNATLAVDGYISDLRLSLIDNAGADTKNLKTGACSSKVGSNASLNQGPEGSC